MSTGDKGIEVLGEELCSELVPECNGLLMASRVAAEQDGREITAVEVGVWPTDESGPSVLMASVDGKPARMPGGARHLARPRPPLLLALDDLPAILALLERAVARLGPGGQLGATLVELESDPDGALVLAEHDGFVASLGAGPGGQLYLVLGLAGEPGVAFAPLQRAEILPAVVRGAMVELALQRRQRAS